MLQLNWALQTIHAGRVPWQFLNITELFAPYNLTLKQQTMAKKESTYTLLTTEHLHQVPFSVSDTPSVTWLLRGFISLPVTTFQFHNCQKFRSLGCYEPIHNQFPQHKWAFPFQYKCMNTDKETFLSVANCKNLLVHSLLCDAISFHGH